MNINIYLQIKHMTSKSISDYMDSSIKRSKIMDTKQGNNFTVPIGGNTVKGRKSVEIVSLS